MDDDNTRDPGQVFAIPDLYAPSRWLTDVYRSSDPLFSTLALDGLNSKSMPRL
jgi:hypothetical protein